MKMPFSTFNPSFSSLNNFPGHLEESWLPAPHFPEMCSSSKATGYFVSEYPVWITLRQFPFVENRDSWNQKEEAQFYSPEARKLLGNILTADYNK